MSQTFYATFDGRVLTPEGNLKLDPNKRYLVKIEAQSLPKQQKKRKKNVLQKISARAKDLGVSDLAEQHDHYLYGTPKR